MKKIIALSPPTLIHIGQITSIEHLRLAEQAISRISRMPTTTARLLHQNIYSINKINYIQPIYNVHKLVKKCAKRGTLIIFRAHWVFHNAHLYALASGCPVDGLNSLLKDEALEWTKNKYSKRDSFIHVKRY